MADIELSDLVEVGVVAAGAQGQVVQCHHRLNPGLRFALKRLRPGADSRRFELESRLLSRLNHPSIIVLLRSWRSPWAQLVEWIEGDDLEQMIAGGALSPITVAAIGAALADAMAQAHGFGVFHRDIKPANIMIRSDGRPVWIDFGIGFGHDAHTITTVGTVMGTPAYMAPEAFETARQMPVLRDIYGLGAVLYECLVGSQPFPHLVLDGDLEQQIADIYELKCDLPCLDPKDAAGPVLRGVVKAMTAREPYRRIATMAEVAEALMGNNRG